ncbi:hypothetical protein [Streptomyces sp. NBC_00236]|uniref:hypothetical protein n=1 Tax=Streptomyces sp. NBC_00236 TaxID=2903639 RepID=UPI002E289CB7|nr:hypothetical protein [Streptomyces sp. NBC_00236]
MPRGVSGEPPHAPPLRYGSFASAGVGPALLTVTPSVLRWLLPRLGPLACAELLGDVVLVLAATALRLAGVGADSPASAR